MRTPTTLQERWEWWERAISGETVETHEDTLHCGYFKIRKFPSHVHWTRNPFIGARVWLDEQDIDPETGELMAAEKWLAEIDGKRVDPWKAWTWISKNPIPEMEYRFLMALSPLLPKKMPNRSKR